MLNLFLEGVPNIPLRRQQVEHVERKGIGHPDTMCDAVMEFISVALNQEYLKVAGRILHYNLDKALLVAGQTSPSLGGGSVDAPMRMIFGGRATSECKGHHFPIAEIAESHAKSWFSKHLRFVDPQRHIVFQNEIKPGSTELRDIFSRRSGGANDTSVGVGYAPLTETERLVLLAERRLNSPDFKARFPVAGEDVKVMARRYGRKVSLIIAMAFVDRFVPDEKTYFDRKSDIRENLQQYLQKELQDLDGVNVDVNTLDRPDRGSGGMYLTVLGTSAEGGDSGEVGRGNRVNGLISFHRPMTTEAAAGKNPVSHVGKIYNVLSHQMANKLASSVDGVEEAYVWLCSQIGQPLDQPLSVAVQVVMAPDGGLHDVEPAIRKIIHEELADMETFTLRLARGELSVW